MRIGGTDRLTFQKCGRMKENREKTRDRKMIFEARDLLSQQSDLQPRAVSIWTRQVCRVLNASRRDGLWWLTWCSISLKLLSRLVLLLCAYPMSRSQTFSALPVQLMSAAWDSELGGHPSTIRTHRQQLAGVSSEPFLSFDRCDQTRLKSRLAS